MKKHQEDNPVISNEDLLAFIKPYYEAKDIMHDLWHIELVQKQADRIISLGQYEVDREALRLALAFHGFVYRDETAIRAFLLKQGCDDAFIEKILWIAWESQRPERPETLEGKILHDAHVLEGGKTYTVVKTLITGSVRGQSLAETMDFMEEHVLGKNKCYLPETIPMCAEMNDFTDMFYRELRQGIGD
ncbi:MAG: hypothetical protein IJK47_08370 [Lachnospiraceae bacterium]|nr:hypothetical protein [Lachnospiraceae bacterium]